MLFRSQAHIADKLLYRHWTSYNDGRCNHLILFDTQTKTYKDLTPGNYSLIFDPNTIAMYLNLFQLDKKALAKLNALRVLAGQPEI